MYMDFACGGSKGLWAEDHADLVRRVPLPRDKATSQQFTIKMRVQSS
jgi:hypothetical protein